MASPQEELENQTRLLQVQAKIMDHQTILLDRIREELKKQAKKQAAEQAEQAEVLSTIASRLGWILALIALAMLFSGFLVFLALM